MVKDRARALSIVLLVVAVVLCVPAVPTLIASVRGWSWVSDGAATTGDVTVTGCHSTLLGLTASCRGTFGYADPGGDAGAQPSTITPDVTIANDPRRHRIGDVVDVSLAVGTHRAYVSSSLEMARVTAQTLGILVVLTTVVYAVIRRRRGPQPASAAVACVVAGAVFAAMWLLLPTQPKPPSGPFPPPAVVGTP